MLNESFIDNDAILNMAKHHKRKRMKGGKIDYDAEGIPYEIFEPSEIGEIKKKLITSIEDKSILDKEEDEEEEEGKKKEDETLRNYFQKNILYSDVVPSYLFGDETKYTLKTTGEEIPKEAIRFINPENMDIKTLTSIATEMKKDTKEIDKQIAETEDTTKKNNLENLKKKIEQNIEDVYHFIKNFEFEPEQMEQITPREASSIMVMYDAIIPENSQKEINKKLLQTSINELQELQKIEKMELTAELNTRIITTIDTIVDKLNLQENIILSYSPPIISKIFNNISKSELKNMYKDILKMEKLRNDTELKKRMLGYVINETQYIFKMNEVSNHITEQTNAKTANKDSFEEYFTKPNGMNKLNETLYGNKITNLNYVSHFGEVVENFIKRERINIEGYKKGSISYDCIAGINKPESTNLDALFVNECKWYAGKFKALDVLYYGYWQLFDIPLRTTEKFRTLYESLDGKGLDKNQKLIFSTSQINTIFDLAGIEIGGNKFANYIFDDRTRQTVHLIDFIKVIGEDGNYTTIIDDDQIKKLQFGSENTKTDILKYINELQKQTKIIGQDDGKIYFSPIFSGNEINTAEECYKKWNKWMYKNEEGGTIDLTFSIGMENCILTFNFTEYYNIFKQVYGNKLIHPINLFRITKDYYSEETVNYGIETLKNRKLKSSLKIPAIILKSININPLLRLLYNPISNTMTYGSTIKDIKRIESEEGKKSQIEHIKKIAGINEHPLMQERHFKIKKMNFEPDYVSIRQTKINEYNTNIKDLKKRIPLNKATLQKMITDIKDFDKLLPEEQATIQKMITDIKDFDKLLPEELYKLQNTITDIKDFNKLLPEELYKKIKKKLETKGYKKLANSIKEDEENLEKYEEELKKAEAETKKFSITSINQSIEEKRKEQELKKTQKKNKSPLLKNP